MLADQKINSFLLLMLSFLFSSNSATEDLPCIEKDAEHYRRDFDNKDFTVPGLSSSLYELFLEDEN